MRFTRWLYTHCWTGTNRPSVLFDRATTWLLAHKVLLPGASILERFIAKLRDRVEERLWKCLCKQITDQQRIKLEELLLVPKGLRRSLFDQLRASPTRHSGRSLVDALERLHKIRKYSVGLPLTNAAPRSRIVSLARFASRAKAVAISRLLKFRRLATLVAFVQTLEAGCRPSFRYYGLEGTCLKKVVSPQAKKVGLQMLIEKCGFSQRRACRLVNVHRSVGRYSYSREEDKLLKDKIISIAHETY